MAGPLVVGTLFPTCPRVVGTSQALPMHRVLSGPAWRSAERKFAKNMGEGQPPLSQWASVPRGRTSVIPSKVWVVLVGAFPKLSPQ